MKVLVTGGTGYVGGEVVRQLLEAGHEVRAMARRHGASLPTPVEHVQGDVADAASYAGAAEGMDAIVHLAAILDGTDEEFQRINAGGPRNAVAAAARHGIRRLLHMSAMGVSEEHAPLTRYWGSKHAGKTAVTGSGLDWTVFEPSFVFGRGGGALATFERPQETTGKVYELAGPQAFTFDELLDELARLTGRAPRRKLHVPVGLMKAQSRLLQHFPPPLKVTREQIVMLVAGTEAADLGPMRADLGIEPASLSKAHAR